MIYLVNLSVESKPACDLVYYFTNYDMAKSEFNRIVKLNQTEEDAGKYDNSMDDGKSIMITWYNKDDKRVDIWDEDSDFKIADVGFMKS